MPIKRVCVVDGQGGGIGLLLVKSLKEVYKESVELIALGTNAIATSQMLGKNAFTFYRRRDDKSARLVARPDIYGEDGAILRGFFRKMQQESLTEEEEKTWQETRERISKRIMESDLDKIFEIKPPSEPAPRKARILNSLICASCGEPVMETRARCFQEQVLCIPCFEAIERRY